MIMPKVFAAGAFVGDMLFLALQSPDVPSAPELVISGGAGGSVALFVYWVVKPSLERHDQELKELRSGKADSKDLQPLKDSIERIEEHVSKLVDRLLK